MTSSGYRSVLYTMAIGFTGVFVVTVIPPFVSDPNLLGAIGDGFVNPYASAFALDAIGCWCVLALWVFREATAKGVRYGWIALVLGVLPGVTTGLAVYMLIRHRQLEQSAA